MGTEEADETLLDDAVRFTFFLLVTISAAVATSIELGEQIKNTRK